MKLLKSSYLFLIAGAALLSLAAKCDRNRESGIPVVPTDFSLNLNLPEYSPLQTPGNWLYLNGGSRGIIVYRVDLQTVVAYDRHCTYQVENNCYITVDSTTNFTATDVQCCQSKFNIIDGIPFEGPAQQSLYTYQAILFGNNTLRIYN